MQIIHFDPSHLPALPSIALTIGNFDGVHVGHQAMLSRTIDVATTHSLKSAVMIFEPQPKEFFSPSHAPARLSNLNEKLARFALFELDYVIIVNFDGDFANLSASEFCTLLSNLNTQALILGDDFQFGKGRMGNIQSLKQHFNVIQIDSITLNNHRISSTLIRKTLATGDFATAKYYLNYPYHITGQVKHGDKIGRTLGFPTANVALNRLKPALEGVFGVAVYCNDFDIAMGGIKLSDGALFGCANIGTRPSVDGKEYRLEVYLPDFQGNLYDKTLTVEFLHFLHGEINYPNLEKLKEGIANDVQSLLTWHQSHKINAEFAQNLL